MQASVINPLSNITFIENFSYEKLTEYLFSSGDMSKFLTLDKYQPFIKGVPYNGFSKFNNKILSKIQSVDSKCYFTSIFNLIFKDEIMDYEGSSYIR